jgi:NAD+ diphosphatase
MRYCGRCGRPLAAWRDAEGRERQRCAACGWVWFGYPTPVVLVLGVATDGRVLYTRRNDWPAGAWGLVAGFVEPGETAEAAAEREVLEESGLAARAPRFVASIPFRDLLLLCFVTRLGPGEPRPGSDADQVDLAPPRLERIHPEGAPARWLLGQLVQGRYAGFLFH